LEVILPINGEMKKQSAGRRIRRKKIRRKKMQVREKQESREILYFSWFCDSGGFNSRLAKPAGAEPASQTRDEKLDQR
jgi:hypothetical protein